MQPEEQTKPSSPGFSRVAKRISSRTTDLLAIAIVTIGLLTVGRQLVTWWQTDAAESASFARETEELLDGAGVIDLDSAVISMEFGDKTYSVQRASITGDDQEARKRLREQCRHILKESDSPIYGSQPTAAEQRLLNESKRVPAIEEHPDDWQMYQTVQPFPVVIGVRRTQDGSTSDSRRVVSWGMAFPTSERRWILISIRGKSEEAGDNGEFEIPVPPDGRIVLSLRNDDGGRTVFLNGNASLQSWSRFLDNWFSDRNWTVSRPWTSFANGHSVGYDAPRTSHWSRIDIHLNESTSGRIDGLLSLSVRSPHSSEISAGEETP